MLGRPARQHQRQRVLVLVLVVLLLVSLLLVAFLLLSLVLLGRKEVLVSSGCFQFPSQQLLWLCHAPSSSPLFWLRGPAALRVQPTSGSSFQRRE